MAHTIVARTAGYQDLLSLARRMYAVDLYKSIVSLEGADIQTHLLVRPKAQQVPSIDQEKKHQRP